MIHSFTICSQNAAEMFNFENSYFFCFTNGTVRANFGKLSEKLPFGAVFFVMA